MNIATRVLLELQETTLLAARAARGLFKRPRYIPESIAQMDAIGVGSLTIIILTGFFTGGVLTLQTYPTLKYYGAQGQTGYLVALSLIRELGPVLTALMVTGRVGSAIAAELGSMSVSQQIDAMRALGTDPVRKLVTPRIIALLITLPLLTVIGDVVGIVGGWSVAGGLYGMSSDMFFSSVRDGISTDDIIGGIIKPMVFMASTDIEINPTTLPPSYDGQVSEDAAESTFAEVDDRERAIPAIEFRDVHLSFDERKVLNGLTFKVMKGETKIILGGSGCGKSTTIKLVLGLLKPDSGQILVDGEDITNYTELEMMRVRKKIGMVFQEGALFDSLSVYDNVAFRLHEQGVPEEEVEPEVRRMLRFVNLEDAIDKMPIELSGGMRRRVGIARALVGDPKIVMFDEPTAGLDPPTARTICELAMKLRDLEDVSSIFVTHEMNNLEYLSSEYAVVNDAGDVVFELEGERLCLINTKVLMLRDGQPIFSGTDEALKKAEDPYIQKFLRGH
jgi:ABC transport permease subunit